MTITNINTLYITPEQAEQWLGRNWRNNRKPRQSKKKDFIRELQNGTFKTTHQGVLLHEDGTLLDGQHRLMAISESGIPAKMVVATTDDMSVYEALDQGAKRSHSDLSGIDNRVVTTVNTIIRMSQGGMATLNYSEVKPFLKGPVGDLATRMHEEVRPDGRIFNSGSFKAACVVCILSGRIQEVAAYDLMKNLKGRVYEDLPPVGLAFLRQVDSGSYSSSGLKGQMEVFTKSFHMFNPENFDNQVLRMSKTRKDQAVACAKSVLAIKP